MIEVERKYIAFFVRFRPFLDALKRFSEHPVASLLEEVGPLFLFGPILSSRFKKPTKRAMVLLLILSLLMVGGPLASLFTFLFGLMGSALYLLGASAFHILLSYLSGEHPMPGVGPIIPGVPIGPFYIPFLEGWLSILLIFLVHEGAHGIMALRKRIPIQDAALVLLGPVPIAAYVMPEEKAFLSSPPQAKVDVLSAGPTANALLFIPLMLVLLLLTPAAESFLRSLYEHHAAGVRVLSVPEKVEINGTVVPSLVYGKLEAGDIIVSVNGQPVYTVADVIRALREAEGNRVVLTVMRDGKTFTVEVPNRGYLGIKGGEPAWKEGPPLSYVVLRFLLVFLSVFATLNLMVAVVNALPFSIFDGGQAIGELEKAWGMDLAPLRYAALLLLLINVMPWFI